MSFSNPESLKLLTQAGIGFIALLILGGALYLQQQERRFEADRSDKDRDMTLTILRNSVRQAELAREETQSRMELFFSNQTRAIEGQERIAQALEKQYELLGRMEQSDHQLAESIKLMFTAENDRLILLLEKLSVQISSLAK